MRHDNRANEGDQLDTAIAAAFPSGMDVHFDNTAGPISDAVLKHLGVGAGMIICGGTASVASWNPLPMGPRVVGHRLVKRARMQGFLIFDHADRWPLGCWLTHLLAER